MSDYALIAMKRRLSSDIVGVRDVLPPVVMDPVLPPHDFRKVFHPPNVMFADVAVAPVRRSDITDHAFEVGEVVEPVVTFTFHGGWIIPIVVAHTVRCKMDVAQCGLTGMRFVVTDEALPQVLVFGDSRKCPFHDGLGAVPHVLKHFTNPALEGKTHDDETSF